MKNIIIEYSLFIGSSLYLASTVIYFYLFLRTLKTKDGIGLLFLRVLTLGISFGSFTIFLIRFLSEHGSLDYLTARALAIVNPLILLVMALYLNYLFHQKKK